MATSSPKALGIEDVAALAASHGLDVDPTTVTFNEAGLDFRVAYADAVDGTTWVLRMPRRDEVGEALDAEAAILELVGRHLPVAVPDWRVRSRDLVAYPLLPGRPGLTMEDGEVRWHLDQASPRYATSLGTLLAALHRVPLEEAHAAGIEVRTPAEVRAGLRADVDRVAAEFTVAPALLDRWQAWLADDELWPTWSVMTHGELYPAHALIDEADEITAVLDWTTAAVGDPGRDFMYQQVLAPAETFELTVQAYVDAGGQVWPRLAEHCAERYAAGPVNYGLYALATGDPEHRAAAAAQLAPEA